MAAFPSAASAQAPDLCPRPDCCGRCAPCGCIGGGERGHDDRTHYHFYHHTEQYPRYHDRFGHQGIKGRRAYENPKACRCAGSGGRGVVLRGCRRQAKRWRSGLFPVIPTACGGRLRIAPRPYTSAGRVSGVDLGLSDFRQLNDLFAAPDGRVYLAVSGSEPGDNRVVVMDQTLGLLQAAEGYTAASGEFVRFEEPMGLFVDTDGDIYICDGKTKEVLHLDAQFQEKRIIPAPDAENSSIINAEFTERYRPSKLAVDPTGRIHVVAININEGIVEFEPDGTFTGFLAAGKVKYSTIELLWRRFSTEEQRARMQDFVPVEYNNIELDGDGYLFATLAAMDENAVLGDIQASISSGVDAGGSSDQGMVVRRINYRGSDILDRNGYGPVVGDLAVLNSSSPATRGYPTLWMCPRGKRHIYAAGQQPQPSVHLFSGRLSALRVFRSGCNGGRPAHAGGGCAAGGLPVCGGYRHAQRVRIPPYGVRTSGAAGA